MYVFLTKEALARMNERRGTISPAKHHNHYADKTLVPLPNPKPKLPKQGQSS